jgi:uncharacterized lipoprotein NlpE involved in copper resistance
MMTTTYKGVKLTNVGISWYVGDWQIGTSFAEACRWVRAHETEILCARAMARALKLEETCHGRR